MTTKTCLKCNHERDPNDGADPACCPGCGAYYAKVEAQRDGDTTIRIPRSAPARRPERAERPPEAAAPKAKSTAVAIGLNLILPGLGYLYMGRWVTGVLCCLLVGAIYMTSAVILIVPTWLLMNLIMAIDMVILSNKHQKKVDAATLMACPECAEMIKREARICRYCRAEVC